MPSVYAYACKSAPLVFVSITAQGARDVHAYWRVVAHMKVRKRQRANKSNVSPLYTEEDIIRQQHLVDLSYGPSCTMSKSRHQQTTMK